MNESERSGGPLRIYFQPTCAPDALDLQVDYVDVRLQVAGRPERHAFAEAAGVVPALPVHRLDVRLQGALRPEGGAGAVRARVVPALLVSRRVPTCPAWAENCICRSARLINSQVVQTRLASVRFHDGDRCRPSPARAAGAARGRRAAAGAGDDERAQATLFGAHRFCDRRLRCGLSPRAPLSRPAPRIAPVRLTRSTTALTACFLRALQLCAASRGQM